MEQRLAHMRANQSQIQQLVGQLSSQLERINKHLELVNGSAEELRLEISKTINKQMPSHLEKLNSSLAEVQARVSDDYKLCRDPCREIAPQSRFRNVPPKAQLLFSQVARVANNLVSTNEQLSSLSSKQRQIDEALYAQDKSIVTIEDAISGNDTSSDLARSLNSTIESSIRRAQADIESSIQQAQSEIHARMSSSLKDSITQMKRELSSPKPTEIKSVPLTASNTELIRANNDMNNNNGTAVVREEGTPPKRSLSSSNSSANSTGFSTTPAGSEETTRSPENALSTLT